jgi:hypothetical protein
MQLEISGTLCRQRITSTCLVDSHTVATITTGHGRWTFGNIPFYERIEIPYTTSIGPNCLLLQRIFFGMLTESRLGSKHPCHDLFSMLAYRSFSRAGTLAPASSRRNHQRGRFRVRFQQASQVIQVSGR